MLTGFQCETIAFYPPDSGEFLCVDCAVAEYGALAVSKSEDGIGPISPVSRYSLDEISSERTWEYAREHVGEFLDRHPALDGSSREHIGYGTLEDRLTDHYAERHTVNETCGGCCCELD